MRDLLSDLNNYAWPANYLYFHTYLCFLVFKREFIRFLDFTRIANSNTASDDVTN